MITHVIDMLNEAIDEVNGAKNYISEALTYKELKNTEDAKRFMKWHMMNLNTLPTFTTWPTRSIHL